jgi:hypothetical protein
MEKVTQLISRTLINRRSFFLPTCRPAVNDLLSSSSLMAPKSSAEASDRDLARLLLSSSCWIYIKKVQLVGFFTSKTGARFTNGGVSDKPRRLPRHQRAQVHLSTHYRCQLSFMYWLCSKQNGLLCAYEHDFGDNYIITIV